MASFGRKYDTGKYKRDRFGPAYRPAWTKKQPQRRVEVEKKNISGQAKAELFKEFMGLED